MKFKGRAVALVVCAALTAAGFYFCIAENTSGGTIYTQAAGVKPTAAVMTISGEEVPADLYLYWVAADCNYLKQYFGEDIDWSSEIYSGTTFQQYVLDDAETTFKYCVAVEQLADQNGCKLTDEQEKELSGLHDTYANYYGGEEKYQKYLEYYGLTDENMTYTARVNYMFNNLDEALFAEGGELEANEDAVREWAKNSGYSEKDYTLAQLTDAYKDPSYGAINDYISAYTSNMQVEHTALYDKLDLTTFYPAAMKAQSQLEDPTAKS
jgi:hypothetical protein